MENERDLDLEFHEHARDGEFTELLDLFDQHKAEINVNWKNPDWSESTALIRAAHNQHPLIVAWLLENTEARNAVNEKNSYGDTPLLYAWDNEEVASILISHGANINERNKRGMTTLIYAADHGYDNVVELLVQHGADVNVADSRGNTPLGAAAAAGHPQVVKILLAHGAEINTKTTIGETALVRAFEKGSMPIVRLLLEAGADMEVTADDGDKALYAAIRCNHGSSKFVRMLLERGANPRCKTRKNMDALRYAKEYSNRCTVRRVLSYEAQSDPFRFFQI